MIIHYFRLNYYFLAAFFLYHFRLKNVNSKLFYASLYLFSKTSFRLPQQARKDLFIVIRTWISTVRSFSLKPAMKTPIEFNGLAALDSGMDAMKDRQDYLSYYGQKVSCFFARNELCGSISPVHRLLHVINSVFLAILLSPFSFSRNRASYALIIREMHEAANLTFLLKRNNIKRLYQFCIYEKDSNFLAYFLSKNGIEVSKIPSEVPLVFANKIIVADELNLCFAYQKEEIKEFQKTIFCDKINLWMPEMFMKYMHVYKDKTFNIEKNSIGFYSSALWLRKKLNHAQVEIGSYDAEEELSGFLSEYMEQRKELKLYIFAHPKEKSSPEVLNETREHYGKIFNALGSRVELLTETSTEAYHKVNTGISLFSTITFERIAMGFKTILAPLDYKEFPLPQSDLKKISVYSKIELINKMNESLDQTKKVFFEKNGLSEYVVPGINVEYNLV
jgi:hypothetical protein